MHTIGRLEELVLVAISKIATLEKKINDLTERIEFMPVEGAQEYEAARDRFNEATNH